MYEALEAVTGEMSQLEITLGQGDPRNRCAVIAAAFSDCAQRVSDATARTVDETERAALRKLYRGLIAGQRIVSQLHDLAMTDCAVCH